MSLPVINPASDFPQQDSLFDPFKILINAATQGGIKSARDLARRAAKVAPAPSPDFVPPQRPNPILPGQDLQNLFARTPQINPGVLQVPFNLQPASNSIPVPPPQPPRPSSGPLLRQANPGSPGSQQGPVGNSLGNIIQGAVPQQLNAALPVIQALLRGGLPGAGSFQKSLQDTLGSLIARSPIQ